MQLLQKKRSLFRTRLFLLAYTVYGNQQGIKVVSNANINDINGSELPIGYEIQSFLVKCKTSLKTNPSM